MFYKISREFQVFIPRYTFLKLYSDEVTSVSFLTKMRIPAYGKVQYNIK